jgi:HPt (histidine-containing phosphotransfer) domain-containing protein
MAAANIAFYPEPARTPCPSQERPVDLVHLAHQTMGDKDLENEVLHMFARQARRSLQEISDADPALVLAAAHRLKGAAAAVGAFKVASAAERLEADPSDTALQAAVGATVVEAQNFILKLCR